MAALARWVAIGLAALVGTLVLAVGLLVVLAVPLDLSLLRPTIEDLASDALQREVRLDGLVLVPALRPTLQVEGLRIANPEGWPPADLLSIDLARVRLAVLPLLQGALEVVEITAKGLRANLISRADGSANWRLEPAPAAAAEPASTPRTDARPSDAPPTDAPEATPSAEPEGALALVELQELSLTDLTLSHRDEASGQRRVLRLDEVTGAAPDDRPIELAIRGTVEELPYELQLTAGSLATLLGGDQPWPVELSGSLAGATLDVSGTIAEPLRGRGVDVTVTLAGDKLGDLAAIGDLDIPPIGAYRLSMRSRTAEGVYALDDVEGSFGDTSFTADFEVDLTGERPRFQGTVDVPAIDARPILLALDRPGEAESEEAMLPDQPEALDLDQPVLELGFLQDFDAQLEMRVHEVLGAESIREASLAVTVQDGVLTAPMAVTFAGVPFSGRLDLAAADGPPSAGVQLRAEDTDIGDLARVIYGIEGIEGGFEDAELALRTRGATLRELIETLDFRFALSGAALSYGHDGDGRPVAFTLAAAEIALPEGGELRLSADGSLLDEPFTLELVGPTAAAALDDQPLPFALRASGGGAELRADGHVGGARRNDETRVSFEVGGERIGDLSAWLGALEQAEAAYEARGTVVLDAKGLRVAPLKMRLGRTTLEGELGSRDEGGRSVPFASIRFDPLDFEELRDLFPEGEAGPGTEPAAGGFTVDLPILPQGIDLVDGDLTLEIARTRLGLELTDLRLDARIRDGRVTEAPFSAIIAGAPFEGDLALDLRGEVPEVQLRVDAQKVDVGRLLAELEVIEGLEAYAGALDIELDLEGRSVREVLTRSSVSASLRDARWTIRDPATGAALEIGIPAGELAARPGEPVTLSLQGLLDDLPIAIDARTGPLIAFLDADQMTLDIEIGLLGAELKLAAQARLPLTQRRLTFQMSLEGERLDGFDPLFDVALPPLGPYALAGTLRIEPTGYDLSDLELRVGDSDLQGEARLEMTGVRPRLDMALTTNRLQLNDFDVGDWSPVDGAAGDGDGPSTAEGGAAEGKDGGRPGQVLEGLLSPSAMRKLDGRLTVTVGEVVSGADRLGSGELEATLIDGRLEVAPLSLEVPGGDVELGFVYAPGEADVEVRVRARIEQLNYGVLARRIDPESDVGGVLDLDVDLTARPPNLQQMMKYASGHLGFAIRPDDLDAAVFDLWAVNLMTAVLPTLDEGSRVNCVVARFQVEDGIMEPKALLIDSTRIQASGGGEVDFHDRRLRFDLTPRSKRPQMFTAQTPVRVEGSFDDFRVGVDAGAVLGTLIRFTTSVVVVPFQWVFSKALEPDGKAACAEAWAAGSAG